MLTLFHFHWMDTCLCPPLQIELYNSENDMLSIETSPEFYNVQKLSKEFERRFGKYPKMERIKYNQEINKGNRYIEVAK